MRERSRGNLSKERRKRKGRRDTETRGGGDGEERGRGEGWEREIDREIKLSRLYMKGLWGGEVPPLG